MRVGIVSCEILCREIVEILRRAGVRKVFIFMPPTALRYESGESSESCESSESHESRESGKSGGSGESDESEEKMQTLQPAWILEEMRIRVMNNRFRNEILRLMPLSTSDVRVVNAEELQKCVREAKDYAIVRITEVRAHDKPHFLLEEIKRSVYEMRNFVDFIVLCYGLCGNSEKEVRDMLKELEHNKIPIYIPSDEEGFFNNCIELILGRDKVRRILNEERGTFFMTPSGASIVGEPHVILNMGDFTAEDSAAVMKILQKHYKQVVKIVYDGEKEDKKYSETVERFAKRFNLNVKVERASSDAILRTFERALTAWAAREREDERSQNRELKKG